MHNVRHGEGRATTDRPDERATRLRASIHAARGVVESAFTVDLQTRLVKPSSQRWCIFFSERQKSRLPIQTKSRTHKENMRHRQQQRRAGSPTATSGDATNGSLHRAPHAIRRRGVYNANSESEPTCEYVWHTALPPHVLASIELASIELVPIELVPIELVPIEREWPRLRVGVRESSYPISGCCSSSSGINSRRTGAKLRRCARHGPSRVSASRCSGVP